MMIYGLLCYLYIIKHDRLIAQYTYNKISNQPTVFHFTLKIDDGFSKISTLVLNYYVKKVLHIGIHSLFLRALGTQSCLQFGQP